jgi:WD40 repeat protein
MTAGRDPRIFVFAEGNNKLSVHEGPEADRRFTIDVPEPWTAKVLLPDAKAMLLGNKDGTVSIWSTESGHLILESDPPPEGTMGVEVRTIAVAPDGTWFAVVPAGAHVAIRSTADGMELRTLPVIASAIAVSRDGARIATATGNSATLWNAETGEQSFSTPGSAAILGLAWSPDGRYLATVTADTINLWTTDDGKLDRRIGGRHLSGPVAFTPDSQRVIAAQSQYPAAGYGYSTLGSWNVATGESAIERRGPAGSVTDVHVSDDGRLSAVSIDASLTHWDVGTRKLARAVQPPVPQVIGAELSDDGRVAVFGRSGKLTLWDTERDLEIVTGPGHYFNPARLHVHGDGSLLATMGDFGMRALYDTDAKQVRFRIAGDEAIFTPDGSTLAVVGKNSFGLDVATGEELAVFPDPIKGIRRIAFSPDGRTFVEAVPNGVLSVRETKGMTRTRDLGGNTGRVMDITFTRDARHVAVVTPAAIVIWDLKAKSTAPVASIPLATPFEQASWQGIENNVAFEFSPEGRHILLGRTDGTIQVFRIPRKADE